MNEMDRETLRKKIDEYKWYHTIEVADGIFTNSTRPHFKPMWDFNLDCMQDIDFHNKRILDIGCRDGLFSFEAEKKGAKEVIGIDIKYSKGAVELLIPLFKSKVKIYELSLYELTSEKFGFFDIVIFFGVLYHLRYPFLALKRITDCLSNKGKLLLEGGMLTDGTLEGVEMLYCPYENSPYEPSSCTFFNKKGLCAMMRSLNFELLNHRVFNPSHIGRKLSLRKMLLEFMRRCKRRYCKMTNIFRKEKKFYKINRQFFVFQKNVQKEDNIVYPRSKSLHPQEDTLEMYWNKGIRDPINLISVL